MGIKCSVCNYEGGSPLTLPFHYKIEHKDKISKCECGSKLLSGVCISIAFSDIRGVASKCPNSNSSFIFIIRSNSNSENWPKPNSNSNSETWAKPHSNSNSETRAKPHSFSNSESETLAKPFSNDERASGLDPLTWVKHNSNYSPTSILTQTNNRIDITNKICNR